MEKNEKALMKLGGLLKARFPFIYIPTWEEERAVQMICDVSHNPDIIKTVRKVFTWTQTVGWTDENGARTQSTTDPVAAIQFIQTLNENAVFILKDFHVYFGVRNRPAEYGIIRKLRDTIPTLKSGAMRKNVIFVSPELLIPDDMQKEISVFEFPLPSIEEIKEKLNEMLTANTAVENHLTEEDKEILSKAALGLTLQETENAFARAMVEDGKMSIADLNIIFDEKNQVIRKSGILEFVKSDLRLEDIGGLDNLKRWLQKRNNTWLDSARKYNVPAPKGVLITGVPGCGKSMTAKAMSAIWKLPLLKLDMGKIFSGVVGNSEENMRRAIRTAEAVAPSVLWVDEIEKGLSGHAGTGDSGTGSRVFGTFLTWMQDKTAPVFVVATANNISDLPPELLRKGRFDEIFFVDLPTRSERKSIFEVHLKKRLTHSEIAGEILTENEIAPALLEMLAAQTEGVVGAEIEQVVISALYEAFFQNRDLEIHDLQEVIANMIPLSVTQGEQIKRLRDWANVRAVAATAKDALLDYSTQSVSQDNDINSSRGGRTIDF
ncbi:MAG: AAA family ATPase [Oscillospiraceae bacterium]|jgi:ATP-dependent 26S proteasome regulatory subunit|nr:AAA family ATPase [Oscillospiraceae bacterium]